MALYWLLDTAHNLPLQNLAAASGNVLEYKGNVALQSMLLSVYEGESILLRLRAGISYRDGTIWQNKPLPPGPTTKPSNRQHHICQNWHLLEPPKPRQFTRSGKSLPWSPPPCPAVRRPAPPRLFLGCSCCGGACALSGRVTRLHLSESSIRVF